MAGNEEPSGGEIPTVRTLDPPIPSVLFEHLINPLIKRLLRSRLHGLVSDAVLLVTVTGRHTGREFSTPVGYERRDGVLYVTSQTDRVWWRNLQGGAPVTVHLRGRRRTGTADVIEDDRAVAEYVAGYIDRHGTDAVRRLAIAIEGDEKPDIETLAAGLGETVVVCIDLDDAA